MCVTLGIAAGRNLVIMLRAINFNDELLTKLDEIENVAIDRNLSSKVKPSRVEVLELEP